MRGWASRYRCMGLGLTLTVGLAATGCSSNSSPKVDGDLLLPGYWGSLGRSGSDIVDIVVDPPGIVVIERSGNTYVQRPAYTGAWLLAPLDFSDLEGNLSDLGLVAVAQTADAIWVGAHLADGDLRPELYTLSTGIRWEGITPEQPVTRIHDLFRDRDDAVWRVDGNHVFVTAADGATWQSGAGELPPLAYAVLSEGESSVLLAGRAEGTGLLRRSRDAGRTWVPIVLPTGVRNVEAAASAGDPERLYAVLDGSVCLRNPTTRKWDLLQNVQRVPGGLFVNPEDPTEVVIVAEAILLTRDGGETWIEFPAPGPTRLETASMDWTNRIVVMAVTDFILDAVFTFDLDEAWAAVEE